MPKAETEKIVLQIQLQTKNDLDEHKIQTLLQSLQQALSTCPDQIPDQTDLAGNVQEFELISPQMLIVTLFSTKFLEILDCLQTWTIHQKQCTVHVKAQYSHGTQEGDFPVSMHGIANWLPFYRLISL